MQKIRLIGKNLNDIKPFLQKYDLQIAPDHAELVVAHGGDGTLLDAARLYPELPVLPIRDSSTAALCELHQYDALLTKFVNQQMQVTRLPKIVGRCQAGEIGGINDVFIHNLERSRALRYRVWIDDELYANEVVGDGVGISSVHGSTAYYKSITHSIFRVGIGLSFSNSTEEVNHLVLPQDALVRIKITRGPGLLVADNAPASFELPDGSEIILQQSQNHVAVIGLAEFMCPRCRALRHPNKSPYLGYIPHRG